MNSTVIKHIVASAFDLLGINAACFAIQKSLFSPFIRVVNYHDISLENRPNFENHLEYFSSRFIGVDEQTFSDFLVGKPWPHKKPGIVISFDDGLTSHFHAAKPLLEKYGFTGWFFVPAERVDTSTPIAENALTADEVVTLDQGHVVGCHTMTHRRLSSDVNSADMLHETLDAKKLLEDALGHEITTFCWVGREESSYSQQASELIKKAFKISFMTNNALVTRSTNPFQVQRTNVEANFPLPLVKFQISGILDVVYFPKRRRVNRLTR